MPDDVIKVGVLDPEFFKVPPPWATVKDLDTFPVAGGVASKVPAVEAEPNVKILDASPRLFVKLVIATVPAATVIDLPAPPNVFVAPSVKVPAPTFVKLLAPDIAPFKVIFPLPPILASAAKATVPVQVAPVPEVFIKAPPEEIPVPFMVSPSAVTRVKPFKLSTAPELTVVAPAVVPIGVLEPLPDAPKTRVPAEIVVIPVYELLLDKVRDPEPDLVKAFTEVVDVEFATSPSGKTSLIVKLLLLPPIGIVSVFFTKSEAAAEFVFQ